MISIVIADDHAVVRAGLRAQLESEGFDVVAEAADGAALIEATLDLEPDVVVMELELPVVDALTATRVIRGARPSIGIVLLATFDDRLLMARARAAGATHCLLKALSRSHLVDVIRAAAARR